MFEVVEHWPRKNEKQTDVLVVDSIGDVAKQHKLRSKIKETHANAVGK